MKKGKMKRMLDGYDHTSDLPDCILSQILSLLPTEDVVRASFVSKRWKSCCSPLSVLDLDFNRFSRLIDQKKRFSDFVEGVIEHHKDQHDLKEFRLSISFPKFKEYEPQIDKWVSFAMTSDLATLDLNFYGKVVEPQFFGDDGHYTLPDCPVHLQSLEVFRLTHSTSLPSLDMSFSLLKTVVLTTVWLGETIYDFIDNCPCLEELHLIQCYLPEHIGLKHPESKLKYLVIDSCEFYDGFTRFIKINIPSLLRFKFAGDVLDEFCMCKPRNLIETELDIRKVYDNNDGADDADEDARHYEILRHLLTIMDNVNSLTLSSSCIQVLTCNDDKAIEVLMSGHESHEILPPPLPNLKHLTVNMSVRRDSLNLACLLKSCPNLETLCVDLSIKFWDYKDMSSGDFDDEKKMLRSSLFPSKYLRRLKKVEIKNFWGRFLDNVFISYILANSLVLEELVIYKAAMKPGGIEEELTWLKLLQEMAIEILMTFGKGSSRARILVLES